MKVLTATTLLIACIFSSCVQKPSSPLAGAWELVEGEMINQDTVLHYPVSAAAKHMKILTETYFATIWQDTTNSHPAYPGMNGGTYTLVDSMYTEHHDYFTNPSRIGSTNYYKVRFEEDRFFMIAVSKDGKELENGIKEEWKRME